MSIVPVVIALLFIFGLTVIGLGVAAARFQPVPSRLPFLVMTLGLTIWTFSYMFVVVLPPPTIFVAAKVQYAGIVLAPLGWVLFCYEYTRQTHVAPWVWAILAIQPIVVNILVWWNPDNLFHLSRTAEMVQGFYFARSESGPLFWAHAVYSYGLMIAGTVILIRSMLRSQKLYRQQIALLLIGGFVPWLGNFITLAFKPLMDITSLLFGVTAITMGWTLFRYRLFDLMPIARERIFESLDDAVFVLDSDNVIVDLNPAAERAFLVDGAQVVGKPIVEVFPKQRRAMRPFADINETKAEVTFMNKTFDMQISPLTSGSRGERGRLIVLRDISLRKEAEAEREALIKELDAYAHTVAHDLKNPLGVIQGYANLLSTYGQLPDKLNRATELISVNTGMLVSIVDDLLLLASVRNEAEIKKAPMQMEPIVKRVLERLHTLSDEYQAEIVLPKVWPDAVGHAGWIEEVWANYISNAIKYGGKPPRVEIGVDRVDSKGVIRYWVRDNGKGLTPDEQSRLFKEFSRIGDGEVGGHGLGLSIVERIVLRLDGTVSVESTPGEGSTFSFTLPAAS